MRENIKKVISIAAIILFISGCQSVKKEFAEHGLEEGRVFPKDPVIFIPGLGYTGEFWEQSDLFHKLRELGWKFGGVITVKQLEGKDHFELTPKKLKPANFYTLTFSSTQLAIIEQGKELAEIVKKVKAVNHSDEVILIGHSMGGLSGREYLQSPYYQNDVTGYVSVGTPHQGSDFRLENPAFELVPVELRDLVWNVNTKSAAVRDLAIKSVYLSGGNEKTSPSQYYSKDVNVNGYVGDEITGLNDIPKRPLPVNIEYFCVIGSGDPIIATFSQDKDSDGIVSYYSANLNDVPGINVHAKTFHTDKDHFHEADASWVLLDAMKPLLINKNNK